jgi:hypothetical protein
MAEPHIIQSSLEDAQMESQEGLKKGPSRLTGEDKAQCAINLEEAQVGSPKGSEKAPSCLTAKDKAQCLIDLQRTLAETRRQTRSIEFKVNISLWTLIAVSASFLHGKVDLSTAPNGFWWFIVIASATYVTHLGWMRLIQNSEDRDADHIIRWANEVETACGLPGTQPARQSITGWLWVFVETAMTAILLFVVGIVLRK